MMLFRLLNEVVVCISMYGVHANYTCDLQYVRDFNEKRENIAYNEYCSTLKVVLTFINSLVCLCIASHGFTPETT